MKMARIEAGSRLVLEFKDAFNRHDVDGIIKLMTPDCLLESASPAPDGSPHTGQEAVRRYWQSFFNDHPNARMDAEEVIGVGTRCILRWACTWQAATGGELHLRGTDVFRLKDSLFGEQFSYVKSSAF